MLSRLYKGQITHHRGEPDHRFSYPIWYAWINLDEIDSFCELSPWLSQERFNLLSFYRQDYLPGQASLKDTVESLIEKHSGRSFSGQVYLLTTLRQLGYTMNPLSLYYCYESGKKNPDFVVAEVHNTPWGERHTYVIDWNESDRLLMKKEFHVSPFMPMDLEYEFKLPTPNSQLQVGIRLLKRNVPIFNANLNLQAQPVNRETVNRLIISHGWQSMKTFSRIYFQALRLWLKKATFFSHPHRQRNQSKSLRKKTS